MVSIAMAPASSCCAVGLLIVVPAGDKVDDEIGSHAAQRDSPHNAQHCEPDSAVGTAANDESDATGYGQRRQRLFFYIFADVAIPPTPFLVLIHCDRPR
jgi:hypothetical protein